MLAVGIVAEALTIAWRTPASWLEVVFLWAMIILLALALVRRGA
jgi:hypothetical protein